MIRQPLHLLGVAAYGILCLVALGFFAVRVRQRPVDAQQRLSCRLLLSMGVGLGCWAADEWRRAAEWPHAQSAHTILHWIGVPYILFGLFGLIWASLRNEDPTEQIEKEKPL